MNTTPSTTGPIAPRTSERLAYESGGIRDVTITGGFWADWQRDNSAITIPHAMAWTEREGTVDNLRRLNPSANGQPERRGLWFNDSNLYKALEAIAWDLGRIDSTEYESLIAEMASIIAAAQEEDGYVNSFVQAGLDVKWDHLAQSHELYCIGHLIQAGIAHKRSTGRDELLDVAIRSADAVVKDFGDGRRGDTDGHEEIETALVELYRETGERQYLDLAQQFVDVRGHGVLDPGGHFDSAYYQDATPVREESDVVGHAVRALYLLAGVVDLYIESGDEELLASALRQWESMNSTKTLVTGALGTRFIGEAFGDSFELPPDLVYGETCATIGNVMTAWRLLMVTGESRFADAIERGMYNLVAASTSVERTSFFYNNPAQRRIKSAAAPIDEALDRAEAPGTRPVWFVCSCCPSNIMRIVASFGCYLATHNDAGIQLHQYVPATIALPIGNASAALTVVTGYPVDGDVQVTVDESPEHEWTLSFRQPDWAASVELYVNGRNVEAIANDRGYVDITRNWSIGDIVTLKLPMEPRLTLPHPAADALRGTVTIERGPLVYALESPDQADGVDLDHIELVPSESLEENIQDDFLGARVAIIHATGLARDDSAWAGSGWRTLGSEPEVVGDRVRLTAIPYFLWANRGPSTMRVNLPVRG